MARQTLVETLASDRAKAIDARATAQALTLTERSALSHTKRIKRLLTSAADELFADGQISEVDRKALYAGEKLARSTTKHSAYFGDIRAVVVRLKDKLAPLMGTADPVADLDSAKTALDARIAALRAAGVRP